MVLSKHLSLSLLSLTLAAAACHKESENKASLPPKGEAAKAETAKPAEAAKVENGDAAAAPAAKTPEPAQAVGKPEAGDKPAPAGQPQSTDYRLTGQVAAVRRAQLGFHVAGYIKTVNVRPGVTAKAGDVLANLDDRDFTLRVELAKVRRDNAKVQLEQADKELKREAQLQKDNASTATTYDKVKSGSDQARLGLRMAELDLQTALDALKDTKLTAPYDLVVAEQLKYDGEGVQPVPPAPVVEVYDLAEPEISLSAPERLMGKIKVGDKLSINVPSAGFSGKSEVTRIVPVIAERTRTFQVYGKINNYDKKVVAGSYAEATID